MAIAPDRFSRFAAIDWSGARGSSHKGIALAVCTAGDAAPVLVAPPARAWSRTAIRDWLADQAGTDLLVGLDLSPAFAFLDEGAYFPGGPDSPADARALWAMVDALARDDADFAADGVLADPHLRRHFRQQRDCGDLFPGGAGRMRVCETGQRAMGLSPTSCFNLVGASQVGKSSLTGMRVLHRLGGRVPVWPFDPLPATGPVIVEIYTALAARLAGMRKGISKIRDPETLDTMLAAFDSVPHAPLARYDDHATDAMLSAAWLRAAAGDAALWAPAGLTPELAQTEGWTFGVP